MGISAMTRHLLVVCTANVCRSPVAERLLARALADEAGADEERWVVTSAGTGRYQASVDRSTVEAAADVGVDMSAHVPRQIDRTVLAADGADLVLTMEREHLRAVVDLDPAAWRRTFTLKELTRRALELPPANHDEDFAAWLVRLGADRKASSMMRPDPADDVADPYGRPKREHVAMVAEVAHAVDTLVACGPWHATTRS